jgi:hypothetical protein
MVSTVFTRSLLVTTIATAVAFTGLDPRPAAAAGVPAPGSAIARSAAPWALHDLSAARKKRRGRRHGFPIAAFGAIIGTIAGIAAAERRREYYEQPYGYYYVPDYGYDAPVAVPYGYAPRSYGHPYGLHRGYHHGGYHLGAARLGGARVGGPRPGGARVGGARPGGGAARH